MILRAAIFLIASVWISATARAAADFNETEVPVRLRPLHGVISVSGASLRIFSADGRAVRGVRNPLERGFKLKFSPATPLRPAQWQIFDAAKDSSTGSDVGDNLAVALGLSVLIQGEGVRVDLRPAPEKIRLVVKDPSSRAIHLVGVVPLEKYLERVVSSEVPKDWPMEALKAQAVAARSYAVARLRERSLKSGGWLESTVMDQVFDHDRRNLRAAEAVRATRGEVLIDGSQTGSDRVLKAHFHADCGGRTDEPADVWTSSITRSNPETESSLNSSSNSSSNSAADPGCALNARNQWRFVATLEELQQKLDSRELLPKSFKVASLSIESRTAGGRALNLSLRSRDEKSVRISGEKLRSVLGYSAVRSTLFDVKLKENRLELVGRGYGHGAGLCQWGARQWAEDGKSYREILAHYYPGSRLGQDTQSPSALSSL